MRKHGLGCRTTLRLCSVVALVSVLTNVASATEAWQTSTVKWVYPQGDGSFVLVLAADPPSCNITSPKYLNVVAGQNGMTADGVKNLLAVALTAYVTGSSVAVAFDNATSSCHVNRLAIQ